MQSFMKIKSSRNGKIILSFTDIGKSCPSRKFLTSQLCLLTLFAKISGFTVSARSPQTLRSVVLVSLSEIGLKRQFQD